MLPGSKSDATKTTLRGQRSFKMTFVYSQVLEKPLAIPLSLIAMDQ